MEIVYSNIVAMFRWRGGEVTSQQDPAGISQTMRVVGYCVVKGLARGAPLCVIFIGERDVDKQFVSSALKANLVGPPGECLVVLSKPCTPHVRKYLVGAVHGEYPAWRVLTTGKKIFSMEVPAHSLVPPHRVATEEEKAELAAEYVFKGNMQLILAGDAMAIWIGARPGDIVLIDRFSETAGRSLGVRLCK
jgi:DNA-directed RNA polymerase subunit H (RpoH/RPB5)